MTYAEPAETSTCWAGEVGNKLGKQASRFNTTSQERRTIGAKIQENAWLKCEF